MSRKEAAKIQIPAPAATSQPAPATETLAVNQELLDLAPVLVGLIV